MNTVKIYRDGKDLYLTKKDINELEYEEVMGERDNLSDALDDARRIAEETEAKYIWVDVKLTRGGRAQPDTGKFAVVDDAVIELEGSVKW